MTAIETLPMGLRKFGVIAGGCWQWEGTLRPNGYGRVWFNGRTFTAHRAVWIASGNPIDDAMELDHLCRNRSCVNPSHLEPVTRAENARRKALAQTHCKHGHPLAGDNVLAAPYRRCRECHRASAERRNRRLADLGYSRQGTRLVAP